MNTLSFKVALYSFLINITFYLTVQYALDYTVSIEGILLLLAIAIIVFIVTKIMEKTLNISKEPFIVNSISSVKDYTQDFGEHAKFHSVKLTNSKGETKSIFIQSRDLNDLKENDSVFILKLYAGKESYINRFILLDSNKHSYNDVVQFYSEARKNPYKESIVE